jgi:Domain of unknown function (DUF4382)
MEARQTFNPATKKLFEYGLIGLAIGAVLIAGVQFRPQSLFPSNGTLQIRLTSGVPVAEITFDPPTRGCGNCNVTNLTLTVTSMEVHTSGIDNMTGMWTPVCTGQLPMTLNLSKLVTVTKSLCGQSFRPDSITNLRLSVFSANATIVGFGFRSLTVPSGKLEVPFSPVTQIEAGKTTTVTVEFEFQSHIVCQGNGDCKLTPVLHAISSGPD